MLQQTTNKAKKTGHYRSNSQYLMQYAGLATQLLVALGLAVFLGLKADRWLSISFPLLAWLMPLLALTAMFIRIFKDTSNKNEQ
ncbi:MAG: AtpZ/AtpI family protein [Lacibacter sp.]